MDPWLLLFSGVMDQLALLLRLAMAVGLAWLLASMWAVLRWRRAKRAVAASTGGSGRERAARRVLAACGVMGLLMVLLAVVAHVALRPTVLAYMVQQSADEAGMRAVFQNGSLAMLPEGELLIEHLQVARFDDPSLTFDLRVRTARFRFDAWKLLLGINPAGRLELLDGDGLLCAHDALALQSHAGGGYRLLDLHMESIQIVVDLPAPDLRTVEVNIARARLEADGSLLWLIPWLEAEEASLQVDGIALSRPDPASPDAAYGLLARCPRYLLPETDARLSSLGLAWSEVRFGLGRDGASRLLPPEGESLVGGAGPGKLRVVGPGVSMAYLRALLDACGAEQLGPEPSP